MASQKTLRVFKRFLLKNEAYEKYCSNLDKRYNNMSKLTETKPYSLISGVFGWSITEEKHEYWSQLSYAWSHFLNNHPRYYKESNELLKVAHLDDSDEEEREED